MLNPGNATAGLARWVHTSDLRADLKYATDRLDLVARPRALARERSGGVARTREHESFLTQGYVRWRPSQALTATAGRELFSRGPANFRSPSSPFYFDAGRTDPLREVSGIDLVRLGAALGQQTATLAHVLGSGHGLAADPHRDTTVVRVDHRLSSALLGLVLAPQRRASGFAGGFGQVAIGEAWLVYSEFGLQRLASQLLPSADLGAAPYSLRKPWERALVSLVGTAYTLEGGQTVVAELLRDGHGLAPAAARTYFDRAALLGSSPLLGLALGQAPRLLSRNYLYLHAQGNPNATGSFWRVSWTANFDDRSGQLAFYNQRNISNRWTLFAQWSLNHGSARSEYRALFPSAFTRGAKVFVY